MLKQIAAVTAMNIASIPSRRGLSLVVVIGMACVVAVSISMLSMATGFMRTVHNTGRSDRAIVLSQGMLLEQPSSLSRDAVPPILDSPGVARAADGTPIASAEVLGTVPVVKRTSGSYTFVTVRGVGPQAFALRPNVKIVAGRMFKPAVHEVIVGTLAQAQFKNLDVGQTITLPEGDWTIVGAFASDDDMHQSEMMTDSETLLSAYRRNTFNSMSVQLTDAKAFTAFKDALTSNPAVSVSILRENDYYEDLSKQTNGVLTLVAYWIGGIMGVGAAFGALNTMYAAVSTRTVEIATLRAIGFDAVPVVVSVFAEALLLAAAGAAIGAGLAWFAFAGNQHGFGGLVVKLWISPEMLLDSVALGGAVGMLGALLPAIRAARLPVATALQAR